MKSFLKSEISYKNMNCMLKRELSYNKCVFRVGIFLSRKVFFVEKKFFM